MKIRDNLETEFNSKEFKIIKDDHDGYDIVYLDGDEAEALIQELLKFINQ